MNDVRLQAAVESATTPVFMSSKHELMNYYQDQYGKNWKSHIASDLSGSPDKKSRAYQSAIRNFQGDRLAKEGRDKARWQALGEKLPPVSRMLAGNSITVTVSGTQQGRNRTIRATLSGSQAYSFVNDPNYNEIYEAYGVDGDMFEGGEYALQVRSVSAA
jgi:hypothetical protein